MNKECRISISEVIILHYSKFLVRYSLVIFISLLLGEVWWGFLNLINEQGMTNNDFRSFNTSEFKIPCSIFDIQFCDLLFGNLNNMLFYSLRYCFCPAVNMQFFINMSDMIIYSIDRKANFIGNCVVRFSLRHKI